jgi:hypothetical protein
MNVRVRELTGIRAVASSEAAPADLALINASYAQHPVTAEDVHIRQARVAHNSYDRSGERFTKAVLERFADTLPGRSLLVGHDTSGAPIGRWFRADTRTRSEDFPTLVTTKKDAGEDSAKALDTIPGFETQRQRVTWLESAFYFANDPGTELQRKNIDTGVWQDVSIGFRFDQINCDLCKADYLGGQCPHIFMQRYDGVLATGTYAGDPKNYEARETSVVYLGCQQQAELTKAIKDGTLDPRRLAQTALGEDLVALKLYEHLARKHGHQQKVWAFPLSSSIGEDASAVADSSHPAADAVIGDITMDLKKVNALLGLPETATEEEALKKIGEVTTQAKSLDGVDLAALKTEAEKAGTLEPLAKIGETALADQKAAYVAHAVKLGRPEKEVATVADALAGKQDYAGLKELAEGAFAEVCKKFPAAPSGDPGADGGKQAQAVTAAEIRQRAVAN